MLRCLLLSCDGTALAGPGAGAVREYFIAALEDVWDYAPSGTENCGAKPAALGETAKGFLTASSSGLGRRHIKAQYVEFIDATFTVRKVRRQLLPSVPGERTHACQVGSHMRASCLCCAACICLQRLASLHH